MTNSNINYYGLVSIIMPNYNSSKFIKKTIDSVISQTYTNWELIIADDCSTDDSISIINNFNDSRIKLINNEKNGGAAVTRNNAIKEAKGKWIAFLDSDDLWEEDKLKKHLEFMMNNDSVFSCTAYKVINSNGELIKDYNPKKDVYTYKDILKHCSIGCSTVIYNCEKLGKVYMPINAEKREDFACWLSILKNNINVSCYHELLTTYLVHSNSVSSKKTKMIKYQWNVLRKVEKISFIKSVYYMINWAFYGFFKYR